jgi:L-ascorbate metabolism protein UlaG (beta-lactamase superfamily)
LSSLEHNRVARAYDKKVARWRALVDWAKHRPWALKLISPMSRGKGWFRFVDRWIDRPLVPPMPDFTDWESHSLAACWIGHATMLLRIGGMTVLTDPVFSSRVGLGWGFGTFGPARLTAPACRIRDLPRIDLILLSHAHFDHLDRPTLARLPKSSTVVCAKRTRDLVDDLGFARVVELEMATSVDVGVTQSVAVTAIPQRHWGARIVLDHFRSYCGFLVEAPSGESVLFGGDTAYQEYWKPVGDAGGVDLAIVGIGAYDPWIEGHADPEQAWQMAMHAGARKVVPMHHSSFKLSREPMHEPLARFLLAAGHRVGDVVCRTMGEIWSEDR